MKTVSAAINSIYSTMKQPGALTCPVYKYTKPTATTPDEFVVINSLPVTGGVLQTCRINVNFYCKDKASGVPDVSRLEVISTLMMEYLWQSNDNANGIYLDLERQNIEREESIGFHYVNFRLIVKLLNK